MKNAECRMKANLLFILHWGERLGLIVVIEATATAARS
jgi:hypothetical protein